MSEHNQTETQKFPISFCFGNIEEHPIEGLHGVGYVIDALSDMVCVADVMDNMTSSGRDGLALIFKACSQQVKVLAELGVVSKEQGVAIESNRHIWPTSYPKLKPMHDKRKLEGLSEIEMQFLINIERGHKHGAVALKIGLDNAQLSAILVKLEKRGLLPKDPNGDASSEAKSA